MYVMDVDSVKGVYVLDARVMYVNDVNYVTGVDVTPRRLRLQRLKPRCLVRGGGRFFSWGGTDF